MRRAKPALVDSGAWIALALTRDPPHGRAVKQWHILTQALPL
jgi:predicted nucleic acid-binding protein